MPLSAGSPAVALASAAAPNEHQALTTGQQVNRGAPLDIPGMLTTVVWAGFAAGVTALVQEEFPSNGWALLTSTVLLSPVIAAGLYPTLKPGFRKILHSCYLKGLAYAVYVFALQIFIHNTHSPWAKGGLILSTVWTGVGFCDDLFQGPAKLRQFLSKADPDAPSAAISSPFLFPATGAPLKYCLSQIPLAVIGLLLGGGAALTEEKWLRYLLLAQSLRMTLSAGGAVANVLTHANIQASLVRATLETRPIPRVTKAAIGLKLLLDGLARPTAAGTYSASLFHKNLVWLQLITGFLQGWARAKEQQTLEQYDPTAETPLGAEGQRIANRVALVAAITFGIAIPVYGGYESIKDKNLLTLIAALLMCGGAVAGFTYDKAIQHFWKTAESRDPLTWTARFAQQYPDWKAYLVADLGHASNMLGLTSKEQDALICATLTGAAYLLGENIAGVNDLAKESVTPALAIIAVARTLPQLPCILGPDAKDCSRDL